MPILTPKKAVVVANLYRPTTFSYPTLTNKTARPKPTVFSTIKTKVTLPTLTSTKAASKSPTSLPPIPLKIQSVGKIFPSSTFCKKFCLRFFWNDRNIFKWLYRIYVVREHF
jgi:hypothetical protein